MTVVMFGALMALLAACRFGGEASPFELVELRSDASADAADTTEAAVADDAPSEPVPEAGADAQAEDPSDSGGPDARAEEVCVSPGEVPGCNPVEQTGCLFSQCVADRTNPLAGRCVLAAGAEPSGCSEDELATSCPAGSGCYDGTCKTLCFCSAECASGECCSAAAQGGGAIGVCEPCP